MPSGVRWGPASRASVSIPTMGRPPAMANPLAALTPTRRALNGPGPKATATPASSAAATRWAASNSATAGMSCAVWLAVERHNRASTTCPLSSASAAPP